MVMGMGREGAGFNEMLIGVTNVAMITIYTEQYRYDLLLF